MRRYRLKYNNNDIKLKFTLKYNWNLNILTKRYIPVNL